MIIDQHTVMKDLNKLPKGRLLYKSIIWVETSVQSSDLKEGLEHFKAKPTLNDFLSQSDIIVSSKNEISKEKGLNKVYCIISHFD